MMGLLFRWCRRLRSKCYGLTSLCSPQTRMQLRTYTGKQLSGGAGDRCWSCSSWGEKIQRSTPTRGQGSRTELAGKKLAGEPACNWTGDRFISCMTASWRECSTSMQKSSERRTRNAQGLPSQDHVCSVDPAVRPRFCGARSVPYAMRQLVNKEFDRLPWNS